MGARVAAGVEVRLLSPGGDWPGRAPASSQVQRLLEEALAGPTGTTLRQVPGRRTSRPAPGLIHKEFVAARGAPARDEAERLGWLASAGIAAPRALGIGRDGERSVLAMEEVLGAVPLPEALTAATARERARLCRGLGSLVARLHEAGLFHRDLYLEHMLVRPAEGAGTSELVLLDAGRLLRRPLRPARWAAKDLAAGLHSFPRSLGDAPRRLAFLAYCAARGLSRAEGRQLLRALRARRVRMERHRPRFGAVVARPRHLAILLPGRPEDLVAATPVLAAAGAAAEFGRVSLLAPRGIGPLLRGSSWGAAEVLELDGPEAASAALERLLPDALLLLEAAPAVALRARLARVPTVAGPALGGSGPLLTHALVPPTSGGRAVVTAPRPHLHQDLAGLLGLLVTDLSPRLGVDPRAAESVERRLAELGLGGAPLALCVTAGGDAAVRPAGPRATLHWDSVLAGLGEGAGLAPLTVAVGGASEGPQGAGPRALEQAPGLDELVALAARARVLVTDSLAAAWIAAALGTPAVLALGPDGPGQAPPARRAQRILRLEGLACAPCGEASCPLAERRCLSELPAEAAAAAALEVLAEGAP
ncbi:MAG: hypothetical protein ISQ08_03225 [Planctomycetes bacterium]|nr:hypothetical protein [Planctomycetota bacterium]